MGASQSGPDDTSVCESQKNRVEGGEERDIYTHMVKKVGERGTTTPLILCVTLSLCVISSLPPNFCRQSYLVTVVW